MKFNGLVIGWVLTLAAAPAAAETAQKFDLNCTKRVSGSGVRETPSRHYRIDLDARRWCMDECTQASEIQAIAADRITIRESDPSDRRTRTSHVIYRGTGKYLQTYENRALGTFITTDGECEPAPFSGLPAPKF